MSFEPGVAPPSAKKFQPGQSGNPRGPIRALTSARRALARELGDHAHEIIATTVRLAVAGDAQCCAALVSILAGGFEAPAASKNAAASPGASSPILPAVLDVGVA
ncbi:hypothetical protein SAMN05414139_01490 [Burkholderia sp. D7]|nr:hypothetical protein SAMN05414139_01490 [Burkholderia sp. D7]